MHLDIESMSLYALSYKMIILHEEEDIHSGVASDIDIELYTDIVYNQFLNNITKEVQKIIKTDRWIRGEI